MTNASFDAVATLATEEDVAPNHGDLLLAPQADGCWFIARHPGGWQMSFSTPADAVGFAVRYASSNGARVWVQSGNNQYEPIDGGMIPAVANGQR